jgi:sn-glycerol 3-phosphate transport system ATP-binding protein
MGADTLLVCRLAGLDVSLTVKVPGMQRFAEGSDVGLQWSAARQYLFHRESGKRCEHAEQQMFASQKKYAI